MIGLVERSLWIVLVVVVVVQFAIVPRLFVLPSKLEVASNQVGT
jgi:uncharacterized protein involved in exopolysaccharide biosynthesis